MSVLAGSLAFPASSQTSDPAYRPIPFEVAQQITAQVLEAVNREGRIPDNFKVFYGEGESEQISAAQAFGLLASAGECLRQGKPSPVLPLFAQTIAAPIVPAEASANPDGALFPTSELLARAQVILDFTYSMKAFPGAIWIGKARVPSGDYFAALAAVIQFARENNELPSQVQVLPYGAPSLWRKQQASKPTLVSAIPPMRMVGSVLPAAPLPSPTLELFPKEGAKLQGEANIVATIRPEGTYANITFNVDGKPLLHTNWPPFVLSLNTAELTAGKHKIKVEASDAAGQPIANREITVLVESNPSPPTAGDAGESVQD
jgi:hypothetical protein